MKTKSSHNGISIIENHSNRENIKKVNTWSSDQSDTDSSKNNEESSAVEAEVVSIESGSVNPVICKDNSSSKEIIIYPDRKSLRKEQNKKRESDPIEKRKSSACKNSFINPDSDFNNFDRQTSGAWESGIKILEFIKIYIPIRLLLICNQIASKLSGEEFSILVNATEGNNNSWRLSNEFYIPSQVVSSTSIDYIPEDYSYNCVIHRHPDGLNSFSNVDKNYINQNFKMSILYTQQEGFVGGLFNLKVKDSLVQLPVKIVVDTGIEDIDISNIKTFREVSKQRSAFEENGRQGDLVLERLRKDVCSKEKTLRNSSKKDSSDYKNHNEYNEKKFFDRFGDERPGKAREAGGLFDLREDIDEKEIEKELEEFSAYNTGREKNGFEFINDDNIDYFHLKSMVLEEVMDDIVDINNRLTDIESIMHYGY